VNLALEHTPLPATVCGYLCPQLCMDHCTRTVERLTPLDMAAMGRATLTASAHTGSPLGETNRHYRRWSSRALRCMAALAFGA